VVKWDGHLNDTKDKYGPIIPNCLNPFISPPCHASPDLPSANRQEKSASRRDL
jgi:hypothetical protein